MECTLSQLEALVEFRRLLHSEPEIANHEVQTARKVIDIFQQNGASHIIEGLGGHGVAIVYDSGTSGATTMFRCELDALPIHDEIPECCGYRSRFAGVGHKCGHDGHMAIITGLGLLAAFHGLKRGRVVLLFQPAEETGDGAARLVNSPAFAALTPDLILALHNVPGEPFGVVQWRSGTMMCGSVGIEARLSGRSSHAAHPDAAVSPAMALARLMIELPRLVGSITIPGVHLITVTHAKLGEPTFGITPGDSTLHIVVRSEDPIILQSLVVAVEEHVKRLASEYDLGTLFLQHDPFPVTLSHDSACYSVLRAAKAAGIECHERKEPYRWSEDFAHYTSRITGTMVGLGAGEVAALHSPQYDFPDKLISIGVSLFGEVIAARHGWADL